LKKEFLQLLKLTKNNYKPEFDQVRFYTEDGFVWAHRIGSVDMKLRLAPIENKVFDLAVNAITAKACADLDKDLSIDYNGELIINGQTLQSLDPVACYIPSEDQDEPMIVEPFEITAEAIKMIQKAALFTMNNEARPMFEAVYMDPEYIVGTNSHFLYQGKHDLWDVSAPVYFPKELIPFLAPGNLSTWKVYSKEAHPVTNVKSYTSHYRFVTEERIARWSDSVGTFPDFRRLFHEQDFETQIKADPKRLDTVIRLTKLAEMVDKELPVVRLNDVFPETSKIGANGRYLQIILKTFGNRPFVLQYSSAPLKPVFFSGDAERSILTSIRGLKE